jgi:hypothetical protein
VLAAAGCGGSATEHAEVSGRVLYKGEPVTGGRVTFVATKGGFAATANIDENGNYKIKAPVGDVQIGVDNSMLNPRTTTAPAPKGEKLKKFGGGTAEGVKGTFVPFPRKYYHPDESGLVYTVVKGAQTHDIPLE